MSTDTKNPDRNAAEAAADPDSADERPTLLLVDDDESCRWAVGRAFERRGYAVSTAATVSEALEIVARQSPEFAVIDLRMPGPSGLTLVARLKQADPNTRIVVLTGYASVATAVEAIKLGATDYLVKPVDADAIEAAFGHSAGNAERDTQDQLLSVDRLAWEHIQRALAQNKGNISATARALGMHRRTLQRKLNKRPARR
ncbi:MAG: response regulator transcription factor [Pseudomonadota bacterium]